MGHGGVGMESVTKRWTRSEVVEEREEGLRRERERVEIDEVCYVMRSERRNNAF